MALRRVTLALVLAPVLAGGCTGDVVIIEPVIDTAINDPDADAFSGLSRIVITVAHEGDDVDLLSQTFLAGQPLELDATPFGDDLVIHLRGFVGDGQVAYGRSCAFAVDARGGPVTPHIFFSRTQKFADTDVAPAGSEGGRAVSFLGSGLFLGATVDRFDPRSGKLSLVTSVSERTGAVEALIGKSPPRVILVGGQTGPSSGPDFLELIDPNRPARPREDFPDSKLARIGMTATSLADGRVIAIGGRAPGGAPVGTITTIELVGGVPTVKDLTAAALAFPRSGHTATALGNDVGAPVLVVGGVDGTDAPVAAAELFKPLQEEVPPAFAPVMNVPRSRHTAALMPDGSVVIIGGVDGAGNPVRMVERFSFDAGFVAIGNLPTNAGGIDATLTAMPQGRYLLAGGRMTVNGAPTSSAYSVELNRENGKIDIADTNRLGIPRAGHQAAALCDGTILVTGGAGPGAIVERYNPPDVGRR